jgi:hypothetical protein
VNFFRRFIRWFCSAKVTPWQTTDAAFDPPTEGHASACPPENGAPTKPNRRYFGLKWTWKF